MDTRTQITRCKTRFAPSPTGLMHLGNLRVALFNYLYAHRHAGQFLLRIEDTDAARSEPLYREAIQTDLQWLGLTWDEGPFFQSERQALYNTHYEVLEKAGQIYPCFCSEAQLLRIRQAQLASGEPPRYPGTCRALSAQAIRAKQDSGLSCAWRFQVPKGAIVEFVDQIKGPQRFEGGHIGDFIVRRADGTASFLFCNAVDDAEMEITHALRGDDHLANTPRQMLILKALGLTSPQYGHFPTILGPDSRPLSKRNGSRSIQALRLAGYAPLGILNYLARLGHSIQDTTLLEMEGLSDQFRVPNVSSGPAHYDAEQLRFWQRAAIQGCSLEACWQLIAPYVQAEMTSEKRNLFVKTIQPNLVVLSDAQFWAEIIFSKQYDIVFSDEMRPIVTEAGSDFFQRAAQLLRVQPWNFQDWIGKLQTETLRKGKTMFFPLRVALTSVPHGPELACLLELVGMEEAEYRLLRAARYATDL